MKTATILRAVKLYKPAKKTADYCLLLAQKLKLFAHDRKLKKSIKNHQANKSMKILVAMNEGGVGNSIEATPLVQAVRIFWPFAEITILVVAGDLYNNWCVPDYITSDADDLHGKSFDNTFLTFTGSLQIPKWVKTINPGIIHQVKLMFNDVCLKPEREYNIDMLRRLGFKGISPPLYVSLKQPRQAPQPNNFRVCLLPGGKDEPRWLCKRWPYYTQLSEQIIKKYKNCQICIIGTKNDSVDEDLLALDGIIDMRDKLTLAETASFLKTAQLVIGNDCGPIHIADAVGAKGIAIFGPTCQIKNGPRNKIIPVSLNLPCAPCQFQGPITCQSPDCMTKLTVDCILEKIEAIISKP